MLKVYSVSLDLLEFQKSDIFLKYRIKKKGLVVQKSELQ